MNALKPPTGRELVGRRRHSLAPETYHQPPQRILTRNRRSFVFSNSNQVAGGVPSTAIDSKIEQAMVGLVVFEFFNEKSRIL